MARINEQAPMADELLPLSDADLAAEVMRKLHYRRAFLQISSNVIRFLTISTIAVAPVYLAFAEDSLRMLFLWFLYPAAVITQNLFRKDDQSRSLAWGLALILAWFAISSISGGPDWFLWVFIGLCIGNLIVIHEIPEIQHQLDEITESDVWKAAHQASD